MTQHAAAIAAMPKTSKNKRPDGQSTHVQIQERNSAQEKAARTKRDSWMVFPQNLCKVDDDGAASGEFFPVPQSGRDVSSFP